MGLGINPFTDSTIPGYNGEQFFVKGPTKLVMAYGSGLQLPSDVAQWLNETLPDTVVFADRFTKETGIQPPKTLSEANEVVDQYQVWMWRQPEIISAMDALQKWRDENWNWEGRGESGASWVPKTHNPGNIRVMAEGGIVTKPTLALIGGNGPEAVVPLKGKFNPEAEFIRSKTKYRMKHLSLMVTFFIGSSFGLVPNHTPRLSALSVIRAEAGIQSMTCLEFLDASVSSTGQAYRLRHDGRVGSAKEASHVNYRGSGLMRKEIFP